MLMASAVCARDFSGSGEHERLVPVVRHHDGRARAHSCSFLRQILEVVAGLH